MKKRVSIIQRCHFKIELKSSFLFAGTALATIGVFLPWEQDTGGASYLGSAATSVSH